MPFRNEQEIKDSNNKGSFANLDALAAAHPSGKGGDIAIIEDGDLMCTWDDDVSEWVAVRKASKLQKVSNNIYEVAALDTEYYSPNQHGSLFGTIYRVYQSIPDASGAGVTVSVDLPRTIGRMIDCGGYLYSTGDNRLFTLPHASAVGRNAELTVNAARNGVDIILHAELDHQGGHAWFDYTV